jgi:uncharacterized repeat protein (TIGR04076 family)
MVHECSPYIPRTPTEYEATNYRPGVPIYPVQTTVISAHKDCGAKHKIGDTWEIYGIYEGATRGFICPVALGALWCFIYAMRFGAELPWGEDSDSCTAVCPDQNTPVIFKIKRLKGQPIYLAGNKKSEISS